VESIDVDISWFIGFVSGGEGGLQGWVAAIALIIASIRLKKLAEITVSLVRLDKTMEENTDAVHRNTKRVERQIASNREL
jgi:hypothetical protein